MSSGLTKGSTRCCRLQPTAATGNRQRESPWIAASAAASQRRTPSGAGGASSRRALLASAAAAALVLRSPWAHAELPLRSVTSQSPSVVTFRNELDHPVKVYWINYSGDAEHYATIPPAGWWTVDTFETHPWRVVDGQSGAVLREHVSLKGANLVRIDALDSEPPIAQPAQPPPAAEFDGWDGVGGGEGEYAPAAITEIGLDHLGGVALISADGFPSPIPIAVGMSDAAQLFHAAGPEFRRPSTMALWVRSLQAAGATVDRVLITRLVGTTVYARIILAVPGGSLRSLDARPSDCLALSMQTGAPLFIGRRLAASQQPGAPERAAPGWSEMRPPTPSVRGSPPVPAQASYAHSRKA